MDELLAEQRAIIAERDPAQMLENVTAFFTQQHLKTLSVEQLTEQVYKEVERLQEKGWTPDDFAQALKKLLTK